MSDKSKEYRAVVIACGRISGAHAHGYQSNNIPIVACADINQDAVNAFGERFGIPKERRYLDYNEMLDKERPEIVSVCSHHHLHAPMTIDSAKYKPLAIFCEKPIALSLGEADAMINACKESNTVLIIGHQRRFSPQYVCAYNALKDGAIGELVSMEAHGHPWTSLLVDGTHTIDLLRWYADDLPISWVFGQIDSRTHRSAWGSLVEDATISIFNFNNGIRTILTLGGANLTKDDGNAYFEPLWKGVEGSNYHHIILRGTEGQIEIDGDAPTPGRPWVRLIKNGAIKELELPKLPSAHAEIVRLLIESIETGSKHLLDASSARATLEVIIATFESSRKRSIIQLPIDIKENPLFEMINLGEI
ncbi:TPA: Gfo/Idh/MocA family oxidoreductase [Candidatus Poribacteria bacterium]|nr:Gfo/Idh/MocA family oxidoreductase [Candidatus Poribacteria bacterium]